MMALPANTGKSSVQFVKNVYFIKTDFRDELFKWIIQHQVPFYANLIKAQSHKACNWSCWCQNLYLSLDQHQMLHHFLFFIAVQKLSGLAIRFMMSSKLCYDTKGCNTSKLLISAKISLGGSYMGWHSLGFHEVIKFVSNILAIC